MKELITPCLWFNGKAQEAAALYCSNFKDTKITAQSPIVIEFEVSGQRFNCLDGGPQYRPNASISFFHICETEEEIDVI